MGRKNVQSACDKSGRTLDLKASNTLERVEMTEFMELPRDNVA